MLLKQVSKLILLLVDVIRTSITFMLILFSYLIMMAGLFTTIYCEVDPRYANILVSIRTLFDVMMTNSLSQFNEKQFISHSALIAVHMFISAIVLLNFFIAALGKIYEEGMTTTGEYAYLASKY